MEPKGSSNLCTVVLKSVFGVHNKKHAFYIFKPELGLSLNRFKQSHIFLQINLSNIILFI